MHKSLPLFEVLASIVAVVVTAGAKLLTDLAEIAQVSGEDLPERILSEYDYMRWFLLPLIGGVTACGCCVLLTDSSNHREAIGRFIFGVFMSVSLTQLFSLLPWIKAAILMPGVVAGIGAAIALFFYAISKPVIRKLMSRSDRIADSALDAAERRLAPWNNKADKQPPAE